MLGGSGRRRCQADLRILQGPTQASALGSEEEVQRSGQETPTTNILSEGFPTTFYVLVFNRIDIIVLWVQNY